jgi:hypothetical protein
MKKTATFSSIHAIAEDHMLDSVIEAAPTGAVAPEQVSFVPELAMLALGLVLYIAVYVALVSAII